MTMRGNGGRLLTSRLVRLKRLLRPTSLQQKVEHVRGLDSAQQEAHGRVLFAFVRALQVLVELVVLHQAAAVQRGHALQVH